MSYTEAERLALEWSKQHKRKPERGPSHKDSQGSLSDRRYSEKDFDSNSYKRLQSKRGSEPLSRSDPDSPRRRAEEETDEFGRIIPQGSRSHHRRAEGHSKRKSRSRDRSRTRSRERDRSRSRSRTRHRGNRSKSPAGVWTHDRFATTSQRQAYNKLLTRTTFPNLNIFFYL